MVIYVVTSHVEWKSKPELKEEIAAAYCTMLVIEQFSYVVFWECWQEWTSAIDALLCF